MPRPRPWLLALGICIAIVLGCIEYVDRPVADYAAAHFSSTTAFALAVSILRLSRLVLALVLGCVLASGGWRLSGRKLPPWTLLPLRCCICMILALLVALGLKVVFGRSQADPLYLAHHVSEFRPFHGGINYGAFPSATMAVATSALTVLWIESAKLRSLSVLVFVLLAASLIVTNGHWVADIVAGSCLGGVIGSLPMRLPGVRATLVAA